MFPILLKLIPLIPGAIKATERLIGRKKSPDDTKTGQLKRDNVLAILQQYLGVLVAQHPDTPSKQIPNMDDLVGLVEAFVRYLKDEEGLDQISTAQASPAPNSHVIIFPVYEGTLTLKPSTSSVKLST
jgi:hypothetical protein